MILVHMIFISNFLFYNWIVILKKQLNQRLFNKNKVSVKSTWRIAFIMDQRLLYGDMS